MFTVGLVFVVIVFAVVVVVVVVAFVVVVIVVDVVIVDADDVVFVVGFLLGLLNLLNSMFYFLM